MEFKDVLKEILETEGISQGEFAERIGATQGTISKWLNGQQEPRFYQLQEIKRAFGYPADFILGITDE